MKYCAFLRGVNVKGTAMKMAEVIEVFKNTGVKNVSSVLATGNILFEENTSRLCLGVNEEKFEKRMVFHNTMKKCKFD